MTRYVVSLDIGHGGGRAFFYDVETGLNFSINKKWEYYTPENDEFRREFNPQNFFSILCSAVKEGLKKHAIDPTTVLGISTASMRHSYVLLDQHGNELYAGPNTDTRGIFYQDVIEETIQYDLYRSTGQYPPLLYLPARLLWFKNERPQVYKKIRYGLCTGDWLTYKLTGRFVTEPSLASSTMLYDLRKKTWIPEFLDMLDLHHLNLPELSSTGKHIGEVTVTAAEQLGIQPGTPVAVGGADTQLGLLACGAIHEGDICIVAGTSIPVMIVQSQPVIDPEKRIWTSAHVMPDQWVSEANAQMAGLTYQWMKNFLQPLLKTDDDTTYSQMEKFARSVPPGSHDVLGSLGAEIFDIQKLQIIRPACFRFPQPMHPTNTSPATIGHFIRAVIENICYAIQGNLESLQRITLKDQPLIRMTGGMTKNSLFADILAQVAGKTVQVTAIKEGTSFGASLCAATAAGVYPTLSDAVKKTVHMKCEHHPSENVVQFYHTSYRTWREFYETLATP